MAEEKEGERGVYYFITERGNKKTKDGDERYGESIAGIGQLIITDGPIVKLRRIFSPIRRVDNVSFDQHSRLGDTPPELGVRRTWVEKPPTSRTIAGTGN